MLILANQHHAIVGRKRENYRKSMGFTDVVIADDGAAGQLDHITAQP